MDTSGVFPVICDKLSFEKFMVDFTKTIIIHCIKVATSGSSCFQDLKNMGQGYDLE